VDTVRPVWLLSWAHL